MKKYWIILILSVAGLFIGTSCTKKLLPAAVSVKEVEKYDGIAFDYYYLEAIKQKLMGNSAEALQKFEECLRLDPANDAVFYQIAQILLNSGDTQNSKKYLLKAIKISPENLWYNIMLAGIYYSEKNIDSTIIFNEKAAKYHPERENLQISLAKVYSESNNYEKAVDILESLEEKYGINENSTIFLIRNYIAEKRYVEAEEKLKELTGMFPESISYKALLAEIYRARGEEGKASDVFRELIEKHPDDPQTQLSLCEFLINQKKYEELFGVLNSVAINNNIAREDKLSLFGKILETGELVSRSSKELEIVLMVLEANYKNDDIVPLLRVDLLDKTNRLNEASDLLEDLVNSNPDNYFAWERLLMVYLKMKDFKRLQERAGICAAKFNRSFLAKVLYAQAAIENGNFDIAFEELRKANILAGNDQDMQLQVVTMKADAYYKSKDYDKAFLTFEEALKIKNDDPTVLNNYAYYLAEQDRNIKEAERMAKSVIEKEKDNTTFLDTYAWVLYKKGRLKEAAKIMEGIINSGESPDAEWYEHYGYILKKQGKCKDAVSKWEYALKLDSGKEHLINEIKNCGK